MQCTQPPGSLARPPAGVGRETAALSRPIEQSTRPAGRIGPGMAAEGAGSGSVSGSRTGKPRRRAGSLAHTELRQWTPRAEHSTRVYGPLAEPASSIERRRLGVRASRTVRSSHRRKYPIVALSWSAPAAEQWRSGGKALSPGVVWPPPPLVGAVATVVNRTSAAVLGPARHPLPPRAAVPDQRHVRHRRRRQHRHQPPANRRDELLPATGTGNSRRHRRRRQPPLNRSNKVRRTCCGGFSLIRRLVARIIRVKVAITSVARVYERFKL